MPGPLRGLSVPGEPGDGRPWVLGMHGLGRLELAVDRPTVSEVVRKGIGTYPATLVDYAPGVLAVGHPHRDSVVLLSTTDGSVLTYDLASFTRMLDGVPCVAVHLLRDSSTRLQQEYTASRRRRRQLAEAEHVLGANPRGRPG